MVRFFKWLNNDASEGQAIIFVLALLMTYVMICIVGFLYDWRAGVGSVFLLPIFIMYATIMNFRQSTVEKVMDTMEGKKR